MAVVPPTTLQIAALVILFIGFLCVPAIAKAVGPTLDSLPMRFAAVILILAVLPYDKLVALGLFLFIGALYVERHHDTLLSVLDKVSTSDGSLRFPVDAIQDAEAMKVLHQGGHAAESHDTMDFMPKQSAQDNEFESVGSIDTKHALATEPLGSKSQSLFQEEMRNAKAMQRGNSDGAA